MNRTSIYYSIFSVCLFWSTCSYSQEKRTVTKQLRTDSVTEQITLNIYDFAFINKYPDYFNDGKMKEILKTQDEEDWEKAYELIDDYVGRFGIQNFYKDTKMIWRLAKLTELFGDREKAKSLYRLVLRHHHQGINIREVELYYDSLNKQEAQRYVPLDYYYEMAEHRKLIDTLRPPRGILLNMGTTVNSSRADYGPSLNILNNVLIFTSKRNTSGVSFDPVERPASTRLRSRT